MNKTLISLTSLVILALTSGIALGHPGHLSGESVHGFLHAEHIVLIIMVGVIAIVVSALRDK